MLASLVEVGIATVLIFTVFSLVSCQNETTTESNPPKSEEAEEADQPFSWLYKALDYRTHWSYDDELGPTHWCKKYPQCCTEKQSPVELGEKTVPGPQGKIEPLLLRDYATLAKNLAIENNGHTVNLYVKSDDIKPKIRGAGLNGTYNFHSLHFHWGKNDTNGAEHSIYGAKFPLEMHLVHIKDTYKDINEARNSSDRSAIAVLGVLFHLSSYTEVRAIRTITKQLRYVPFPDSIRNMTERFPLRALLPKDIDHFYRYSGSLTTPGCEEVVAWTVFKWSQPITLAQLQAFRSIFEEDRGTLYRLRLSNNFRPLQALNGRSIYDMDTTGVMPNDDF